MRIVIFCIAFLLVAPAYAQEPKQQGQYSYVLKLSDGTTLRARNDLVEKEFLKTLGGEWVELKNVEPLPCASGEFCSMLMVKGSDSFHVRGSSIIAVSRLKIGAAPASSNLIIGTDNTSVISAADAAMAGAPLPSAGPARTGLVAQSGMVPYFKDGRLFGVRVVVLTPEGFLAKIGLQKGDIITNLDGAMVGENPVEVLRSLTNAKPGLDHVLLVERSRQTMQLSYRIE